MQFFSDHDPTTTDDVDVHPGDDWWSARGGWQRMGTDGLWHWLADPGDDHPDDGAPRPSAAQP